MNKKKNELSVSPKFYVIFKCDLDLTNIYIFFGGGGVGVEEGNDMMKIIIIFNKQFFTFFIFLIFFTECEICMEAPLMVSFVIVTI